jgi:hypothetical protein
MCNQKNKKDVFQKNIFIFNLEPNLVKSSYGSSPPWLCHKIEKHKSLLLQKWGSGWMRTCRAPAKMRAPMPHSDGETMRPWQSSSRAHHMHSSSGLAQQACLACLFGEITFKEIVCEDSAALSQGWWSRNFSFCLPGIFQLPPATRDKRVYFLPDFSAKIDPKIKQRFTLWASPALMTIFTLKKYCSHPSLVFFFFAGGHSTPYTWLKLRLQTETANSWETTNSKPPGRIIMIDQLERVRLHTETANSWETTNSKPPGRIIMIDQLERGSTNQIRFITLFSLQV